MQMNGLDMRTAVINGLLSYILCTAVMVALWWQTRKRFEGLSFWAINFFFQTVGLFLISLRAAVPDWMSIFLSNTLIVTGAFLGYLGLEKFVALKCRKAHFALILGAMAAAHAYLTFIRPSLPLRSVNIALALLLIFVQSAWLLLRRVHEPMHQATRWVGYVFILYASIFSLRILLLLFHPYMSADYFHSGAIESVFYILIQMLFVLLTYSISLMVNRRLLIKIQAQEEKFSKAFHSSPYAILLTRMSDGKIFEVNDGFTAFSGYTGVEVLGQTTGGLALWAQQADRDEAVARLATQGRIDSMEFTFRKKSGELLTGLFSASIIEILNERCMLASISDITERKQAEAERERLVSEREKALNEVKALSGLLPICMSCKKIRDDKGYWNQIELYIRSHSQAEFSHGLCPDCMQKMYPEYADSLEQEPISKS